MIETTVFEEVDVAVVKVSRIEGGKLVQAGFQVRARGNAVGPLHPTFDEAKREASALLSVRRRTNHL